MYKFPLAIIISSTLLISGLLISLWFKVENQNITYGDILTAGVSLLAASWFTASLMFQSRQIHEQREQFDRQFEHIERASKREALTAAKEILNLAEGKACLKLKDVAPYPYNKYLTIDSIPIEFDLAVASTSSKSQVVHDAFVSWVAQQNAFTTLFLGIKMAARVYLESTGQENVNYDLNADEFIVEYGELFLNQLFLNFIEVKHKVH